MTFHAESEMMLAIGRLEGKVDTLIQLQRMQEEQIKNHEDRLRQLEHSKSYAMGIAAAVGAIVSTATTLLSKTFN
jgi:TolA-binding protein